MKTLACVSMLLCAASLAGCASNDAEKFVGSWGYVVPAKAVVNCGLGGIFDFSLDNTVETFVASGDTLVKNDNGGCLGLKFTVKGNVAAIEAGQSCTIPASGMTPAATFAPTTYTFTIAGDETKMTQAVTAKYTPQGGSACDVTGANALAKQ
jgi:hypothetical protein